MAKPDLLDFLYNEPDGAAKAADRSKLEDKHARAWAEALARLDPNNPPHDVPLDRWQRFIEDCECFHRLGWANRAEALGWGPLDLFGCDRDAGRSVSFRLSIGPDRILLAWELAS